MPTARKTATRLRLTLPVLHPPYHISTFPVSAFHCLEKNSAARKGMIYSVLTSLIQAVHTRLTAYILFPRYE